MSTPNTHIHINNPYKIPSVLLNIHYKDDVKIAGVILLLILALWIVTKLSLKLVRLLHDLRESQVFFEITPPRFTEVSVTTTTELFTLISKILTQRTWKDRLLLHHHSYSFELVSDKIQGIRYLVRVPKRTSSLLEKTLRAYIPGLSLKVVEEYLPKELPRSMKVTEFRQAKHFALAINVQNNLKEHDPLSYLTGSMTQLREDELMAVQILLRPITTLERIGIRREIARIKRLSRYNRFADWSRNMGSQGSVNLAVGLLEGILKLAMAPLVLVADTISGSPPIKSTGAVKKEATPAELELEIHVKAKLSEPLFEATVRTLVIAEKAQLTVREMGLRSSFASFEHPNGQGLVPRKGLTQKILRRRYLNRLGGMPLFLSSSEIGSFYHFPHTITTDTEDLIRVKSKELPAPLTLKNNKGLDVVFGKNTYGNTLTTVGLSDDDRSRHVYLLGQTGSGKTTVMHHMASDDIKRGRGLAVVDPHGDLAEDLLSVVPLERMHDLIYLNPYDVKYPIGINLLELAPTEDEDELELEKELVCEGVISIFRRVFNKDEDTDAHRIEYILRNTIYTAFTVPDCTIFTVYDLLNDPNFRKPVIKALKDENLRLFWKNEFGKAGSAQVVKMVGGVTSKVGRFLFSPTAKRILEQPKSTINFDEILTTQKILICNLAEGKIGEDTSNLLGTMVISKIQQASVRRVRKERSSRTPFYLFVDEFQNFATSSFTKLLSGGRKFGLRVAIAEQSTAQQSDRNMVNVILANTGTVICFRTASPVDEELMLSQFSPSVEQGDIGNLPRYHFYMRLSAIEPSAAFSGETLPMPVNKNLERLEHATETSRINYTREYVKPEGEIRDIPVKKSSPSAPKKESKTPSISAEKVVVLAQPSRKVG